MTFARSAHSSSRGLTLPELLFVLAIIAVLMTVGFTGYTKVLRRAEGTQCMTKLRGLHHALQTCMQEKKAWPQEPEDDSLDDDGTWDWWYEQMKPYGVERPDWFCPAEWRLFNKFRRKNGGREVEEHELGVDPEFKDPSYIPTQFGPGELEPYASRQPWLIERNDNHEDGHFIVLPNGQIHKQQSLLKHNRVRSQR